MPRLHRAVSWLPAAALQPASPSILRSNSPRPRPVVSRSLQDQLLTKATDVFSFGVLCYEMAAAQRAWAGRSSVQIMYARSQGERLPLPQACPSLGFKVGGLRRAVEVGNGSGQWIWAVACRLNCHSKGGCKGG